MQTTDRAFQGSATFPLLADSANYVACAWDLSAQDQQRVHALRLFRGHFPKLIQEAVLELQDRGVAADQAQARADQAHHQFQTFLDRVEREPSSFDELTIIRICIAREQALRDEGIEDPYRLVKQRENEAALAVLPQLLQEIDQTPEDQRPRLLIEGCFTGNIFDLGATDVAHLFTGGKSINFHDTRRQLKPRPWLYDGFDAWERRMLSGTPYRRAILFVDNAGCDVVLGMIPLARALAQAGTRIILTANTTPALNDITHDELVEVIERVAAFDGPIRQALDDGRLELLPSGNGLPLIDLTKISPELAQAARREPVDLVVLEGMGRSIESNFSASLACDSMKIAMLKDRGIARSIGGDLYDLVMKYEQVGTPDGA